MKTQCSCVNPIEGKKRGKKWIDAVNENSIRANMTREHLDIVFYGDSIIEGWGGTAGGDISGRKAGNDESFKELFQRDAGGKYEGILLGMAADIVSSI